MQFFSYTSIRSRKWVNLGYFSMIEAISTSLKFIFSEKATKFCEIFPLLSRCLLLTTVHTVKSKGKKNFVAFLKYMNFTQIWPNVIFPT